MKFKVLVILFALIQTIAEAQEQHFFAVDDHPDIQRLVVLLNSRQSQGSILPAEISALAEFECRYAGVMTPLVEQPKLTGTKILHLNMDELSAAQMSGLSNTSWFAGYRSAGQDWKLHLSEQKPLDLHLNYATGKAEIDLSGLPVNRFNLSSGSADIVLHYASGRPNPMEMDSLHLNVDWGSIHTKNLHLSNARHILADVYVGKLYMDFSCAVEKPATITAGVGAGRIEVILPGGSTPVRIRLNDSPLCRVSIPDSFVRTDKSTFVYPAANSSENYMLDFVIDVAMGTVRFRSIP